MNTVHSGVDMAAQAPIGADTSPSPWPAVANAVVLLTAAISVLLTAFAWPITWLALGVVLCLASGLRTRRTASAAGMAAQPAARGTA
jgi:hypothetical protein